MSNHKVVLGTIGKEDQFLKIDAKNTFFKKSYKTYSNFGLNWNTISNNNKPSSYDISSFPPKSKTYFRIPFQGDIILDTIVRFKIMDKKANDSGLLNQNIDDGMGELTSLSLLQKIQLLNKDKNLSEMDKNYLACYYKLYLNSEQYKKMKEMTSFNNKTSIYDKSLGKYVRYCYLPLPFWYSFSEGLGLPMWSLTDPTLGINIELDDYSSSNVSPGASSNNSINDNIIFDIELLVKYAYLNNIEKKRFKSIPLEYYIDQIDIVEKIEISETNFSKKINLPTNNFIKFIMVNLTPNQKLGYNSDTSRYEFDSLDSISNINISVNGNLILKGNSNLTSLINRYQNFMCPIMNKDLDNNDKGINDFHIHTHSFCLEPMNYKASGFLSTKKFNDITLEINGTLSTFANISNYTLNIYQIKTNIIRINNGDLNILFN